MDTRAHFFRIPCVAAVVAAMLVCACTPQSSIDSECRANPVTLPAQPVRTDAYYAASEALMREDALSWASRSLLQRGFAYVETDGNAFASVAGRKPAYVHFRLGQGEAECTAMNTYLAQMDGSQRAVLMQQLAGMGLRPSECLVVEPRGIPEARYRLHAENLSPERHWYDGLTARHLNRLDFQLRDAHVGGDAPPLAHIRSVTLSYQVTVSGAPVSGCGRSMELRKLQQELLQPLGEGRKPAEVEARTVRLEPTPFALVEQRPLQVLSQQPGAGTIDWRERNRLHNLAMPMLPNASTSSTAGGWMLRMAGTDDRWREVPLSWIRERTQPASEADRMYFDQPVWLLRSPADGVALFVVWRRAFRVDQGVAMLTYAEYSPEGVPLRRIEAPLPLAPGVNPFEAHLGLPQWDGNALRFRVTELHMPERHDTARTSYTIARVSDYRWNVAD